MEKGIQDIYKPLMSVTNMDINDSSFPFGLLFLLLVSIAASVVSNVALKNHGNLVNRKSQLVIVLLNK